jgi:hypothetical protein
LCLQTQVRAEGITTDLGIFVAPQTKIVEIQVVRRPLLKFDSRIGGTVWIGQVSLTLTN